MHAYICAHLAQENNPEDYCLNKCDYEYYNCYSAHRLFRQLRGQGFQPTAVRAGKLTPQLLEDFDMIFINLMHEQSVRFTPEEIKAVHAWVEKVGMGQPSAAVLPCGELCSPRHVSVYVFFNVYFFFFFALPRCAVSARCRLLAAGCLPAGCRLRASPRLARAAACTSSASTPTRTGRRTRSTP